MRAFRVGESGFSTPQSPFLTTVGGITMFGFVASLVVLVVAGYFFFFKPGTVTPEMKKDGSTIVGGVFFTGVVALALWVWWGYSQLPPALENCGKTGIARMGEKYILSIDPAKAGLTPEVIAEVKGYAEAATSQTFSTIAIEKVVMEVNRFDFPYLTSPLCFYSVKVTWSGKGTPAAGGAPVPFITYDSWPESRYKLEKLLPPCGDGSSSGSTLDAVRSQKNRMFSPSYR